jgi:hypothetical protein
LNTIEKLIIDKNNPEFQKTIPICEAVDCYQAATKSIITSAGKFGTLTLYLCHECAVTKFGHREHKA